MLSSFRKKLAADGAVYLKIKAIPGRAKTEFKEALADGTLKIAVAAAPERGRANKELLAFLAEEFGVGKGGVKVISGSADRLKLIKITAE